jgi:hypothetical protein
LLVATLFAASGFLTLVGCGDGRIALYPVTGTVMVDGQPAEEAQVIFCPIEGEASEELARLRPMGRTDASGKYQLFTFDFNDGAPAGNYKVMVRWDGPSPAAGDREGRGPKPMDRLRGRYFNPEASGLTASVKEEATEIPPFDLKTR